MSDEFMPESNFTPKNDGINHINIYSKGSTWLGQKLSNFALAPFECEHGKFNSIEGYWFWLSSGKQHDDLRELHGFQAKKKGEECKFHDRAPVNNFNEYIKEAIRCKIRTHKDIRVELKNSTLPLLHYYYYGDIRNPQIITLKKHDWMVDEFTRIRSIMQESNFND